MPRAFWKGSINFGLVHIPVRMYKATSPNEISFRELHGKDSVPLQQKRVCPADGEEVDYENVSKGYEIAPDRFVVIKPAELKALQERLPQTIDISDFVELKDVDPLYFKQSYYLVPDTGATKPYQLLLEAMRQTGKAAIAQLALRMRQHLAILRPVGDLLGVSTLYYADEVVSQLELEGRPAEVKLDKRELDMARQLIDSLSAEFKIDTYHNEYRDKLVGLLEEKSRGMDIKAPPKALQSAKVIDLMDALEASLAATRKKPGKEQATKQTKRATTTTPRTQQPTRRKRAA